MTLARCLRSTRLRALLAGAVLTLGSSSVAAAIPPAGTLDHGFRGAGKLTIGFGAGAGSGESIRAMAQAKDGQIVTGSGEGRFYIARYKGNGRPDRRFGGDGQVQTTFLNHQRAAVNAVAVQPDGKVLAAGTTSDFCDRDCPHHFALTRYNRDGRLDKSFGQGGMVITHRRGSANAVRVLPSGRILVAGSSNERLALARFRPNGALDPSFGNRNGWAISRGGSYWSGQALALWRNGQIVVAGGRAVVGGGIDVSRFNRNGRHDTAFGKGGAMHLKSDADPPGGVAIQPDGKILVASADFYDLIVIRLTIEGEPDPSFGENGVARVPIGGGVSGSVDLAVQSDGRIIVGGGSFVLARMLSDGSADQAFGVGGQVMTPLGQYAEAASLLLGDDRSVTLGGGDGFNSVLVRHTIDGALDQSFGSGGIERNPVRPATRDRAYAIAIGPRRTVAVGGRSQRDFALLRLKAHGRLDRSFGRRGRVVTDVPGGTIRDLTYQGRRLIAAGDDFDGRFVLARYTARGALDRRFGGGDGMVTTRVGGSAATGELGGVATQRGGKIVVMGRSEDGGRIAIVRYTRKGRLDRSFGRGDGVVLKDLGGDAAVYPAGVAVSPGGEIVAVAAQQLCHRVSCVDGDLSIIRLRPNGKPARGFGRRGIVATHHSWPFAMALQRDGHIVVAGSWCDGIGQVPCSRGLLLARYDRNGHLDGSFGGGDGIVTAPRPRQGRALAVQEDGKILVVGVSRGKFLLRRFDRDGSVDQRFGNHGAVRTALGETAAFPNAIAVSRSRVLVAGWATLRTSNSQFAVASYRSR